MADYYLKKGDSPPTASSFAVYNAAGVAQTIGGISTVTFSMYPLATPGANPVTNAAAASSAVGGDGFTRLQYSFTSTDTATAGDFVGKFTLSFAGGHVLTYPDPSWLNIHIDND